MKTLTTLFSRTSTGAIQTWQMIVDGNKYYTITGQQDGKKIENEPTVCEGKNIGKKNETSPSEQALCEAQSKWDKKLKTGYTTDVNKIDSCTSYVEPMLAKNLKDRLNKINWKVGVLVQNKFNGARCVATWDGEKVLLKSRKGELYISVPHINKDLEKFFIKYPDAVLDGELFSNDLRQKLNELMSLIRKSKNVTAEELKNSESVVQYFIYDGYNMTDSLEQDVAYETRKSWIDQNLPKFSKYYHKVETTLVHSMKEVDEIFGKYVADGQEGVIVRISGSSYENKRSASLLKYKPVEDSEAIIIDIQEGSGNWAGTGKIITLEWNKKTFNATFKGTMEEGVKFLKEKKNWIGKEVKFQYNGLTGFSVPNYARVDIDNCDPRK